ncbi:MAG: 2-C-methyl-D-erythritol 2,4-cyclodiphosphate synthase [Candidatus Saccharicenans sp.]|nr:MAG: 2-C-methyl-D-erythritol 2,4-cyclodiphosphate synthase [Candidatus Aminicenantes bacterium]HEK85492.1 2-C-methyl-D-erythritol 2,4-cyclodiphosphate synthase [Candidatus Aminicenantes bacterium]
MSLKIGLGYDLHRLVSGRALIIGGLKIPYELGCLAHSDGDVLVHSLIDALLGATGNGDIGQKFPDSDPAFKNISSLKLLEQVMEEVSRDGFSVISVDSVVILEKPKLAPFIPEIKSKLSRVLSIEPENLGVKAKTAEGLGEIGQGKAIASYSVVLLEKK